MAKAAGAIVGRAVRRASGLVQALTAGLTLGLVVAPTLGLVLGGAAGCSNNPYPGGDDDQRILYGHFDSPPKTLDPAVSYSAVDHAVTGPVFGTLLEYHYLKRPYELIPVLAESIPEPETSADGSVTYRFRLRPDLLFQNDPCFALSGSGSTRSVDASDVLFQLHRIGDPAVVSPVASTFARIRGFAAFSQRLEEKRADPAFAQLRIDRQYAQAGGIEGLRRLGPREFELELTEAYPQILFWFAMEFTTPLPWEAIEFYDGEEGRDLFSEHPVGTGPYVLDHYDKRSRIAFVRNPNWHGARHPEWRAPGTVYPSEGAPGDDERGLLDPAYVGRPLPILDRIELRVEKEPIPAFNKFLQGYYDLSGIIEERFDQLVADGTLSPEMEELGMSLDKSTRPAMYHIGFNMDDSVVGSPGGDAARKLRQAMSLAIDIDEYLRIFMNGRGIPAYSPIPPGLFGYDPARKNAYRTVDLPRARRLLEEAGYAGGIDPSTRRPLRMTFDTADTSARGRLRYQFFVDSWRRLGLDVEIAATNYNQFQEKIRKGAFQIFLWGWIADYPDPENFMFLLWSPMARSRSGGPNSSNFSDPAYDELFLQMRAQPNGPERLATIREMEAVLEHERPWIELFFPEDYVLQHDWLRNVKPLGMSFSTWQYRDLDPERRARRREEWNRPVVWPAWALVVLLALAIAPGVSTYFRERQ